MFRFTLHEAAAEEEAEPPVSTTPIFAFDQAGSNLVHGRQRRSDPKEYPTVQLRGICPPGTSQHQQIQSLLSSNTDYT